MRGARLGSRRYLSLAFLISLNMNSSSKLNQHIKQKATKKKTTTMTTMTMQMRLVTIHTGCQPWASDLFLLTIQVRIQSKERTGSDPSTRSISRKAANQHARPQGHQDKTTMTAPRTTRTMVMMSTSITMIKDRTQHLAINLVALQDKQDLPGQKEDIARHSPLAASSLAGLLAHTHRPQVGTDLLEDVDHRRRTSLHRSR